VGVASRLFLIVLLAPLVLVAGIQQPASPSTARTPRFTTTPPSGDSVRPPASLTSNTSPAGTLQAETGSSRAAEGLALLNKIYDAAYRFNDLLSLLKPETWPMNEAARAAFQQSLQVAKSKMQALEEVRHAFSGQLQNASLGEKTQAAIDDLLPDLKSIVQTVAQYGNPGDAAQLNEPLNELPRLRAALEGYVTSLKATEQTPGPAQPPAVQPQPAAAPASAAPLAQPAVSHQASPSSTPPAAPNGPAPAEILAVLNKIYNASSRFNDLVSLLKPDSWRLGEATMAAFQQNLETLKGKMQALEEARHSFSGQPQNTDLGSKTVSALDAALPAIDLLVQTAAPHLTPAEAEQLQQPAQELARLRETLQGYLTQLNAKLQAAAASAGANGIPTERIAAPPPPVAPLKTLAMETPPLSPDQVKLLLHKIYVPLFRIRDLLSQEHPEQWLVSAAERQEFDEAHKTLESKLADLETWRERLDRDPSDVNSAFETYTAIDAIMKPLEAVSRIVADAEGMKAGDEYRERGQQIQTTQQQLVPYISFFLRNQEKTAEMFQADLANCQSELGYAMHAHTAPAVPMKNINPIFQGHPRAKRNASRRVAPNRARKGQNKLS
jgi:hypothetical protein